VRISIVIEENNQKMGMNEKRRKLRGREGKRRMEGRKLEVG
jgi:hypothetical protein